MKDLILMVVVGALLGVLASATIVVVREGEAHAEQIARAAANGGAAADSLAALTDSVGAHVGATSDSLRSELAGGAADTSDTPETALAPATEPTRGMPDSVAAQASAERTATRRVQAGPLPGPEELAGYLAAMQPRDAARVLQQMEHEEVATLLAMIGGRKASAIMGSLPPELAAAIGRLAMGRTQEGVL